MIKALILYYKYYISVLMSSRNKLKGKCIKCGKCCKSIIFRLGDNSWINSEAEFELLKQTNSSYRNFEAEGEDEQGRLLFRCRYLGEDNLCKVHFYRSLYCRLYPFTKSGVFTKTVFPPEDCGYYFEINKPFESYMK